MYTPPLDNQCIHPRRQQQGRRTGSIWCWALLMALSMHLSAQQTGSTTQPLRVTEVCVANIDQTIDYSNNYGSWIELYNTSEEAVDLEGWYVSDDADSLDKHRLEHCGRIEPGGYKCIFFDHHAADGMYGKEANKQVRFKLNKDGGTIYLSPDSSAAALAMDYPHSIPRCSYALTSLEGNQWAYCGQPTPGEANAGYYGEEQLEMPQVNCDSRLFSDPFSLVVNIPEGTTLRYTLDGTTPTLTNGLTGECDSVVINQTTVVRMRLFADGYLPSGVLTRTFILRDKDYYLPIVAITTDPRNLYDNYIGCYVNGKNGVVDRGSKVAIASGTSAEIETFELCNPEAKLTDITLGEDDFALITMPVYGGRIPALAIERMKTLIKTNGAKCAVVAAYGNRAYDDSLLEMYNTCNEMGFRIVAAVGAVAEHSIIRKYGAARPDADDVVELKSFGVKIQEAVASDTTLKEGVIPGKIPYKKPMAGPNPTADKSCKSCGKCATECPVGAISLTDLRKANKDLCISCMRCVSVCPSQSRGIGKIMHTMIALAIKKGCAERKKNELFI